MADFTITVPDIFVPRLVDPIHARATDIENYPITLKILAAWGKPDVPSLTAVEKGELCALVHLWQLVQSGEVRAATVAASEAADESVLDDFNP